MAALEALTGLLTHPLLIGPLLWLGTIGPEEYRTQALAPLYQRGVTAQHVAYGLTALKAIFAYGLVRQITNGLNALAFRNWRISQPNTPWNWPKEIAVVTGGSGDIAAHVVRNLVKKGVTVAILDIRPPAEDLLRLPKVKFYQCDLTSSDAIKAVAAKINADSGVPTILINNAGIGTVGTIFQITQPELERVFKVNILHHYYTVQAFLPGMIKAGKGHVLGVASMASYVAVPGITHYCSSKAAALSFYEGLTQELQHRLDAPFISTSCVHPIWVQGAMTDAISKGLKAAGDALITQEEVAREITNCIFSGHGNHITIPRADPRLRFATWLRALPPWLNNFGNSTLKHQTQALEAAQAERYAASRQLGIEVSSERNHGGK